MTLSKAISLANDMRKGNTYDNDIKTIWVNEVENSILRLVQLNDTETITYVYEDDEDTELNVPDPYSKVYWAYLCAMVDLANGEFDRYTNLMTVYDQFLTDYKLWYKMHEEVMA